MPVNITSDSEIVVKVFAAYNHLGIDYAITVHRKITGFEYYTSREEVLKILGKTITPNQGFITMLAFLSQRYLLAIQGMKKYNKS